MLGWLRALVSAPRSGPIAVKLPSPLAFDARRVEIISKAPISIFRIKNAISPDIYDQLIDTFPPADAKFWRLHPNGLKKRFNNEKPPFHRFMAANEAWRQVYEAFASQEAMDFFHAITSGGNPHRPEAHRRTWRVFHELDEASDCAFTPERAEAFAGHFSNATPVNYGFEFSLMEAGSSLPPHTDVETKLLSLMLYLPLNDAQSELGTEFYGAKPGVDGHKEWASRYLAPEQIDGFLADHDIIERLAFAPNTLVGFVKSDISWHGLAPVAEKLGPRLSVNINYYLPPELLERDEAGDASGTLPPTA